MRPQPALFVGHVPNGGFRSGRAPGDTAPSARVFPATGNGSRCRTSRRPAVPRLLDALHHTNFGINFDTRRDDYVSALFQFPEGSVTRDSVQPQVGEFGVRGIHVSHLDSGAWQVNFKLPPGLEAGWHDVTLRMDGGPASNSKRIAVDLPANTSQIKITAIADGTTWQPNSLDLKRGNVLVLWVAGLPENADRANLRVILAGQRLPVVFAGGGQVNAEVPDDAPSGRFEVEVEMTGGARTAPMTIEVSGVGVTHLSSANLPHDPNHLSNLARRTPLQPSRQEPSATRPTDPKNAPPNTKSTLMRPASHQPPATSHQPPAATPNP